MIEYLLKQGFSAHQGQRHVVFHKDGKRTQVPRQGNKELGKSVLGL